MGKGGGGSPAPTTSQVNQSNLPEYARPYFEDLMQRGQTASQVQYQPYGGERTAGFSPLQQQGFQGVQGLGPSALNAPAAGMTGAAGLGALGAGQNYAQQATSPGSMQAYMSPYMQNVVDFQKTQAVDDYGRQLPGQQAAASRAGAFGGSRQAIVESEAQRNLQNTLGDIQAQGSQRAFEQANKNLQFGSQLGLQGLGLAGQMGQQFGQLGQTAFGQQAAAAQAQQAAGATQQAQSQDVLNRRYEDFMQQQTFPQSQLQFYSSLLRGVPVSPNQTMYQYQAPATAANQIASLGLGAYGTSKLFGAKDGGEIKGYAVGGIVGGTSPQQQYELALTMPMARLEAIMRGEPGPVDVTSAMLAHTLKKKTQVAQDGMAAQSEANQPSVLQQQVAQAGLEAVPVENMDIPDGGIAGEEEPVAMFEGGEIRRYQVGGRTGRYLTGEPATLNPMQRAERITRQKQNEIAAKAGKPLPYPEFGYPMGPPPEQDPASLFQESSTGLRVIPGEGNMDVQGGLPEPTAADVAATPAQGRNAPRNNAPRAPVSKPGIAALIPSSGGEPDAAADGPSSVQGMAPGLSRAAQESDEDMLKRFAEQAGTYTKSEREALRRAEQESQTKGETGLAALRDESRGVAALRAAAELGKRGRGGIESLGAAFGAAGETGAAYGKEKRGFEKDLDKSRMDMAKADLAFKQGDFELGSKLMGQSQDRKIKAAELAAQTVYREAMVALQGTQLTEQQRHNRATEKAQAAHTAMLRDTGMARAEGKGRLTSAQESAIKDKAKDNVAKNFKNMQWLMDYKKKNPGVGVAELQNRAYQEELTSLSPEGYSFASAAPTSIQIPDAAAGSYFDATK
jgi:hypothetical protein